MNLCSYITNASDNIPSCKAYIGIALILISTFHRLSSSPHYFILFILAIYSIYVSVYLENKIKVNQISNSTLNFISKNSERNLIRLFDI